MTISKEIIKSDLGLEIEEAETIDTRAGSTFTPAELIAEIEVLGPRVGEQIDYSSMSFNSEPEDKGVKSYGSFHEYLDVRFKPGELGLTDYDIAH